MPGPVRRWTGWRSLPRINVQPRWPEPSFPQPVHFRLPAILVLLTAAPAAAQLRPLAPADWHADGHSVACGAGYYRDIGVGILGARGALRSLGDCAAVLDLGGARVRLYGEAWRTFETDTVLADPPNSVRDLGPVRSDWGELVLETQLPVRFRGTPWRAGLRFGVRLPVSNDHIGLERDKTDLHIMAMGGFASGRWTGHAEAGVGIHGTRVNWREQQDVLSYSVGAGYRVSDGVAFHVGAVGHVNDRTERGNENQGEVRAALRWGRTYWTRLEVVAGYTEFSPRWGVRAQLGRRFP